MKTYENVPPIERETAEAAFSSGDGATISRALVSVSFHDPDWKWAQEKCLAFLNSSDPDVSGLAATCLGHIARIHRRIDKATVIAALRTHLIDQQIAGRVEDALEDIELFAK